MKKNNNRIAIVRCAVPEKVVLQPNETNETLGHMQTRS